MHLLARSLQADQDSLGKCGWEACFDYFSGSCVPVILHPFEVKGHRFIIENDIWRPRISIPRLSNAANINDTFPIFIQCENVSILD